MILFSSIIMVSFNCELVIMQKPRTKAPKLYLQVDMDHPFEKEHLRLTCFYNACVNISDLRRSSE